MATEHVVLMDADGLDPFEVPLLPLGAILTSIALTHPHGGITITLKKCILRSKLSSIIKGRCSSN